MKLPVKTERLHITAFDSCMAESVHRLSLDGDNRRFIPDEVFETAGEARQMIETIIKWYGGKGAPVVCAITLDNQHIGHVQAVPLQEEGWEIGYHIGEAYTGKGYATEAVKAFLPAVVKYLELSKIYGVCHAENYASRKVLEKSDFVLEFKGKGYLHGRMQEICRYVYSLPEEEKCNKSK
jgi:RimJ/RimL family protein N-acetyltransferase